MNILQMSLSASILIIFVAILRKFPTYYMSKHIVLIIWKIVFFRLLIPFTTSFKFLNITPIKKNNIITEVSTRANVTNIPIINSNTANTINKNALHLTMPTSDYKNSLFLIWIIGICISLLYFFISYIKISTIIKETLTIQDNDFTSEWLKKQNIKRTISIVTSDRISTPITFGIIRPKIVIPLNMNYQNKKQFSYVLTHELVHIEGFDAIWKVVSILTLCIHWFNPLVWMMYNLFNRDVEIACDEKVISIVGENQKSDYAMTLIHLAEQKSDFNGLYNSFAKNPIKERIVNIMKYKKNKMFGIGIGLISIIIAILLIITFSKKTQFEDENEEVIKHVVEQIFTCPDNEMMELFNEMNVAVHNTIPPLSSVGLVDNNFTSNIEKNLEKIYASYISDKWFASFINHFYMEYYIYSTAIGYEAKVNQVVIRQSETIPTNYSFTIYLNYGPRDGNKKDIEIEGSAQILQDDEKISYIQFFTDKSFMLELRENNVLNQ